MLEADHNGGCLHVGTHQVLIYRVSLGGAAVAGPPGRAGRDRDGAGSLLSDAVAPNKVPPVLQYLGNYCATGPEGDDSG